MQRFRESENGDILEYITNQQLAESHCALSAEDLRVRERVRRILMNRAVHFPVKGSLQEDDDERLVEERLDEGDEKRWWEDNERMYWRRCPKRDGERDLREGLEKMSIKERWEGGKVCAECRDCMSQRTGIF